MPHHCHATGCQVQVPPEMFMCRKHWYSLPKVLRDRIWATYRLGQCDDWHISHEYANAAREAVSYLAAKEGLEPSTRVYDMLDPKRYEEDNTQTQSSAPVSTKHLSPYQQHCQMFGKGCGRENCSLAKHIVLCRGTIPCDVLFVGEAPGESEDVIGQPFIGPAGQLLQQIIERAMDYYSNGKPLWTYALTNVVACIPREEDGKKTSDGSGPALEDKVACSDRLRDAIKTAKPRLIISVGGVARDWLDPRRYPSVWRTSGGKILVQGAMAGQTIDSKYAQATIDHPAYILRSNIAQRGLAIQRCIVAIRTAVEAYLYPGQPPTL